MCISGNRCIRGDALSERGLVLNDSHAEIIACRGFRRYTTCMAVYNNFFFTETDNIIISLNRRPFNTIAFTFLSFYVFGTNGLSICICLLKVIRLRYMFGWGFYILYNHCKFKYLFFDNVNTKELMHCHCGTNNRAPRWTFMDPCKPKSRPGAREESVSPAWPAAPAMNARDTKKCIYITPIYFWYNLCGQKARWPHQLSWLDDVNASCRVYSLIHIGILCQCTIIC